MASRDSSPTPGSVLTFKFSTLLAHTSRFYFILFHSLTFATSTYFFSTFAGTGIRMDMEFALLILHYTLALRHTFGVCRRGPAGLLTTLGLRRCACYAHQPATAYCVCAHQHSAWTVCSGLRARRCVPGSSLIFLVLRLLCRY